MGTEAHVRIDEGIKRPRRKPGELSRRPEDLGSWKIPSDLNPDEVIDRYLVAETTTKIARQYGLSRRALVAWLRDVRPEEWKRVQIIRALIKKEDSETGLETAPDALSLARARECLRSAQFDLERLDSRNWGQKQEVSVSGTINFTTAIREISERRLGNVAPEPQIIDVQVQHDTE